MRNRFNHDIRKGLYVDAFTSRGLPIAGTVVKIEYEEGRGRIVTLDCGVTVGIDDCKPSHPFTPGINR
jgi:hypothetical protein